MLRRMLEYYERELQHVRGVAGEFAADFPKIADRLGLDKTSCQDPYVERLLEGLAYLSARIQFKLDAEFPRFTQYLLETVYPQYLAPTPSMAVVQFIPDLEDGGLAEGRVVPVDTALHAAPAKGQQTACEYRTRDALTLYPLRLVEAAYHTQDLAALELPEAGKARAALRIRLASTAGLTFNKLRMDTLRLHLRGVEGQTMRLYEQLLSRARSVVLRPASRPVKNQQALPGSSLRRVGFQDDQALLPSAPRTFEGYRLLLEYFVFPERFMFVDVGGLSTPLKALDTNQIDVFVLLDKADAELDSTVNVSNFELFACPAINLFPRRCDRIALSDRTPEYRVEPDRTQPYDYEIYQVQDVVGYNAGVAQVSQFRPFYRATDLEDASEQTYFAVNRRVRTLTTKQQLTGSRAVYPGTEVWLSLVDPRGDASRPAVRELGVSALCTNRDLPIDMPCGAGAHDFTVEGGLTARCLGQPTRPRPSYAEGDFAWRLISHLSLNYLSLIDSEQGRGAHALRELLRLYVDLAGDGGVRKGSDRALRQVDGVKSVSSRPIIGRVPGAGPIAFARGLEITVTFDEAGFGSSGAFLLGAVLDEFFARYVSINSFTQTVVRTVDRGEVMRWPARMGRKPTI